MPVIEDHNHWIDQMGDILIRYPVLEIGRRLAAKGSIAATEDVFLLRRSEIREAIAGKDEKALVAQRRAEMERFAKVVPPLYIGAPAPPRSSRASTRLPSCSRATSWSAR